MDVKTNPDDYGADSHAERRMLLLFVAIIGGCLVVGGLLLVTAMALDQGARARGEAPRIVYDTPSPDDRQSELIGETKRPAERIEHTPAP